MPALIQKDFDLKKYNTMGVSCIASEACIVSHKDQLHQALETNDEIFILGGGSNILLPERLNRRVLINELKQISIVDESGDSVYLQVGSGENWHQLVRYTVDQGWGGIENLALIPGTSGAAPIQNIGAYGVELKDVFISLDAIELESGKRITFSHQECQFGYRDSIFKHQWKNKLWIESITLKLTKSAYYETNVNYQSLKNELERKSINTPGINDVFSTVISIRQSKLPDPDKIGNTGSFFKNAVVDIGQLAEIQNDHEDIVFYPIDENTVKIPTGWMIERCGWKGKNLGPAGVYKKQALVLVNLGGATSSDIKALASQIMIDVKNKFGVEISPEVNYI